MSVTPSDLSAPVDIPQGPTEGAAVSTVIDPSTGPGPDSLIGLPVLKAQPVIVPDGQTLVGVDGPWHTDRFDPSVEGCPVIARDGTLIPSKFVDQVISIGASNGITIAKR